MATTAIDSARGHTPVPARPATGRGRGIKSLIALAGLGFTVYTWIHTQGSLSAFFASITGSKGIFRSIIGPNLPGDWSWKIVSGALNASVLTFTVAWLSIVFGVIGSLALLPFAARNIAPSRVSFELTRSGMAVLRAIPELIMLLLFTTTIGLTPFAMVCALTFHGVGVKGKLFAEAVEEMDMAPIEALRVAGASRFQVFVHAVLPGVRNTLLGLTLYRLDGNFRSAVALGVVGGVGIGFLINNTFEVFQFKPLITYMVIMVIWVLVIERVSEVLRARLHV